MTTIKPLNSWAIVGKCKNQLIQKAFNFYSISPFTGSQDRTSLSPRLLIKGLPYNVTIQEILAFFKGCKINKEEIPSIEFMKDTCGNFNGQAYIYCKNQATLEDTIKIKRNCLLNGKRITLFIDNQDDCITGSNRPLLTKLDRARFPKDNR